MAGIRKIWWFLLAVSVAAAMLSSTAQAAGDGTGGGGGAAVPLYMDWSYPADGATGVSVTPVIQCKFSHNVAQGNISERNKTFITLEDAEGTNVDITVFMADTQIQFDKRQFIFVSPVEPLSYGTTYILTIHEGIQAKNYMTTDQIQTVTFTTEYARSSFNAPLVSPPDFTELSGGLDLTGTGEEPSGEDAAEDAVVLADGPTDDSGDAEGVLSDEEGDGKEVRGGNGETDAAVRNSETDETESKEETDVSTSNGKADTNESEEGIFDSAADGADRSSGESSAVGLNPAAAAVILLLLCLTAGAAAAGIWSGRKKIRKKRTAVARPVAFFLILALLAGGLGAGNIAYATVPQEFTVRVFVGDTLVSETVYTDEELRAMKQTRQVFSGVDEDELPCITGAEGITLTDLVEAQGVDISELESISVYGLDGWLRNMTYDYLYGVGRYYFPHLSEAYRIRESLAEAKEPSNEGPSDEEMPGEEMPDEEAPDVEPPDGETPGAETPDEEMSDVETQDGEMPDAETPDGEMPDAETPEEEMPDKETPDEETSDGETPDIETPDEETPDEETPDGETPDEETPDEETPDGEMSDAETPDEETPDGETPDAELPDEETSDGETPDAETPDGKTPDEETPEEDVMDPDLYQSQDAERVVPMLALRSCTWELGDEVSWTSLSSIVGYRFCFGQMSPTDGSYLMYGYNLYSIDIKVSAAGEFAEEHGLLDLVGNRVMTSGGADSAGSADVAGPYINPFTGETIDQLPYELEVQVGYFGTDYNTIKTFTFEELAAMPLVRQAYSAVSKDGTNGILTAMGVRLVDVITAAGVDVNSVSTIGFFQGNQEGAPGVTASKAWLLDIGRYYYPNLTSVWNYTTGGKGAARSAVRADTMIALKDYWDPASAVPDFFRLDGTHRYHLVYGQTSTRSDNLEKSILWISTIKIQLEGSPSIEDWQDEYLGELVGSGSGEGTGSGNGGSSGGGYTDAADSIQTEEAPAAETTETEETLLETDSGPLEKIDAREKRVYELFGGSASWNFGSAQEDYRAYIAAVFGAVLVAGAGAGYISYRFRIRNKRRRYSGKKEKI